MTDILFKISYLNLFGTALDIPCLSHFGTVLDISHLNHFGTAFDNLISPCCLSYEVRNFSTRWHFRNKQ